MNASAARGSRCDQCGTEYPPGVSLCLKDGTPTVSITVPEARHPMQGQFAGSYKLLRPIGGGASGEVFLAEHPTLAKQVAVKLLRPALCKERELVKRFFAEAQAVAHLKHPGLVQIYDLSVTPEGRAYYVMDYLDGQNLARYLRQKGRLNPSEALPLLIELLDVLRVAHDAGIVHRDLKPANIFIKNVPRAPRVVLLDFGIAKFLSAITPGANAPAQAISLPGVLIGTPQYMSPEQIARKPIGPASDLYAVGVLLFELLTGELPFHDEPLSQRALHQATRLRQVLPGVSRALDAVCAKALALSPEERYASAAEMAAALSDALDDPEEALALTSPRVPILPDRDPLPGDISLAKTLDVSSPKALSKEAGAPGISTAALVTQPEVGVSQTPLADDTDPLREPESERLGVAPPVLENAPTTARTASGAKPRPARDTLRTNPPPKREGRAPWPWALGAALLVGAGVGLWRYLSAPLVTPAPLIEQTRLVLVESEPKDATITLSLNGTLVATQAGALRHPAAPGQRAVVEVSREGYQSARQAFVVEGERSIVVQLRPLPASAPAVPLAPGLAPEGSTPPPAPAQAPQAPSPAANPANPSPAGPKTPTTAPNPRPNPPASGAPQKSPAPTDDPLDAPQDTTLPNGLPAPSDALDEPETPKNPFNGTKKPKRPDIEPKGSLD